MRHKNRDKTKKYPQKVIHYDAQGDVFYIGIKKEREEEFVEVAPGINAELNEKGELIGVEILNASRVLKPVLQALQQKKNFQHALA